MRSNISCFSSISSGRQELDRIGCHRGLSQARSFGGAISSIPNGMRPPSRRKKPRLSAIRGGSHGTKVTSALHPVNLATLNVGDLLQQLHSTYFRAPRADVAAGVIGHEVGFAPVASAPISNLLRAFPLQLNNPRSSRGVVLRAASSQILPVQLSADSTYGSLFGK